MTFSATLDRTVRIYRANFARFLIIAAILGILQLPLFVAMQLQTESGPRNAFPWWIMFVFLMVNVMVSSLEHAAIGRVLMGVYQGAPISPVQALASVATRLPTLLGVGFLSFLLAALAMPLLVFPGFYVFLGFSLAFMAVVAEDQSVISALKRSWALARGRRWRIFGLMLAWGILSAVISFTVSSAFGLLGLDRGATVKALANQVAAILIAPGFGLSLGVVYFDARVENEGYDLALAAQQLPGAGPVSGDGGHGGQGGNPPASKTDPSGEAPAV
jgi:hypothetical protein